LTAAVAAAYIRSQHKFPRVASCATDGAFDLLERLLGSLAQALRTENLA